MEIEQCWKHPHVHPEQPVEGKEVNINPPVFAWKDAGRTNNARYTWELRRAGENSPIEQVEDLRETIYLPEKSYPVGRWEWRWSCGAARSEWHEFRIGENSFTQEIPGVGSWMKKLEEPNPRLGIPSGVKLPLTGDILKSRLGDHYETLESEWEALLKQKHNIEEPPYRLDRSKNYEAFFKAQYAANWERRRFMKGAETLALGYLLTGNRKLGRAAAERLLSVSEWDPMGSSHISHNDEAHMAVICRGPMIYDWTYPLLEDEEKAKIIAQFRQRGQITFDHMHDRGQYGIDRFDSHAGREIIYLAYIAIALGNEIEESHMWLNWLRPVLCGIWPIWAGPDGAWAEGDAYSQAYVTMMSGFAWSLKSLTGVNVFKRDFWKNYAYWLLLISPPYAEWRGFGDQSEVWKSAWETRAQLLELIGRQTEEPLLISQAREYKKNAENYEMPESRKIGGFEVPWILDKAFSPEKHFESTATSLSPQATCYPHAGWFCHRTNPDDEANDIAFIFRSSPYGAISHSHANNNDFIFHVGGKVMAHPSGYYDGYGSPHHSHWVWHSKSHNCLTLGGASQIMRSPVSQGKIIHSYEDDNLYYFCGNADPSYQHFASHYRRHVVYLKSLRAWWMLDAFIALDGMVCPVQWNIHASNPWELNEGKRTFLLQQDKHFLMGHINYHLSGYFHAFSGFIPPPNQGGRDSQYPDQHHLMFSPTGVKNALLFGVLFSTGTPRFPLVDVDSQLQEDKSEKICAGSWEIRYSPEDTTLIRRDPEITIASLTCGKQAYEIKLDRPLNK